MHKLSYLFLLLSITFSFSSQAKDYLWIGAHPDDEMYVAPLFKKLCVEKRNQCHIIVFTLGEKGHCHLGRACRRLSNVRRNEMRNSANHLNAKLYQFNLGDGTSPDLGKVANTWVKKLGGTNKAYKKLSDLIKKINPTTIYTFDPRHGVYCHADHRATGVIALSLLEKMKFPKSKVQLVESIPKAGRSNGNDWVGFQTIPRVPQISTFHAHPLWDELTDVMSIHKSQFTQDDIDAAASAPKRYQKLYFIKWIDTNKNDSRFNICQ